MKRFGIQTAVGIGLVLAMASCSGSGTKQEGQAPPAADSAAALKADTLAYTLQTVQARELGCKGGDEGCTYARVVYPDLAGSGATPALAANILRGVTLATNLVSDTAHRLPALEKVTQAFVDSFTAEKALYKKLDPEAKALSWSLDVKARLSEANGLVFLETESYAFTGGAHGNNYTGYRAYDRQSGAPVLLENLLQDEASLAKLQTLAERQFRLQEGLKPKQGYQDYFFEKNRFALPTNWRIRQDTLEFVYNAYEIKPYAAGTTQLKLPTSAIDSLFTPAYRKLVQ